MEEKRFFWIKLKTDFFQEDSPIDFLLSQPNGSEYVVLYIKLCLMTANGNGKLQKQIGEMIIPYDIDKITRDMKYFSRDTVMVALEMYKKLGLIYQDADGILVISNHAGLVGSESATRDAIKKRNQRLRKREQDLIEDSTGDMKRDTGGTNCPIEIRDKSIEIREQRSENRGTTEGTISGEIVCQTQSVRPAIERIVAEWNTLSGYGIAQVSKIASDSKRYKNLSARLNQYSEADVFEAIQQIRESDFLQGKNNRNWTITFDWFVLPTNFPKVLDGNYRNKEKEQKGDGLNGVREWLDEVRRNDMGTDGSSTEGSVSSKDLFGF